jgi:ATP-binding cassette subfamily B protein
MRASLGTWEAVRRVAGCFRPYRWRLIASVVLAISSVGLSMTWPLLLQEVINEALPQHRTGLLAALCGAMITAGVLSSVIMLAQGALANSLGQAVVHRLRADVYDQMQAMPLEFFSGEPNTQIQALLASDIGGISDLVTFTAQAAIAAVVSLIAASLVMLILSWPLALASLLLAGGLNLANVRFIRRRRELAAARQEKVADMLKAVGEDLTMPGVILGRTLRRTAAQRDRFLEISGQVARLTCRQRLAGNSARALIGLTLACLPPAIYWLSGTLVPGLSLGAVVVLSTMQARLSGPIQQLLSLNGEMQASLAMFERVFACLDLERAAPGCLPGSSTGLDRSGRGTVSLQAREVSFRYQRAGRAALNGIDLTLRPGTTTVIAGTSGSGKSTLALILAGLLQPASGLVEINGRPAPECLLREMVTLVAQEGATFNATLAENLRFAKPGATERELHEAIEAAGLSELVAHLGGGLDTVVGERGYQLSGGERQRVAIARAMLAPAPVLIIDEATSALDAATAGIVHRSLREHTQAGALLMITHRLPRLTVGDQIVLLEEGRIAATGTHDELQRMSPVYARLLRMQAGTQDGGTPAATRPGGASHERRLANHAAGLPGLRRPEPTP